MRVVTLYLINVLWFAKWHPWGRSPQRDTVDWGLRSPLVVMFRFCSDPGGWNRCTNPEGGAQEGWRADRILKGYLSWRAENTEEKEHRRDTVSSERRRIWGERGDRDRRRSAARHFLLLRQVVFDMRLVILLHLGICGCNWFSWLQARKSRT